jgi:hypothetical protein
MGRTRLVGVSIGDLRIAIEAPPALPWRFANEPAAAFAATPGEADLHLGVRVGRVDRSRRPDLSAGGARSRLEVRPLGDGFQVLHRRNGHVEREARLDRDLREGLIILDAESPEARRCGYPLAAPLDRWIVRHRLARSGGLLIPACAAVRNGRAMLFAGGAGAGKRAVANAIRSMPGVTLLSDRVVALRVDGTGFRVHATPWSEPGPMDAAPLDGIQVIQPGPRLGSTPLDDTEAVASLLGVIRAFDDATAHEAAMATVERLAERVPVGRAVWDDPAALVREAWGLPSHAAPWLHAA